RKMPDSEGVSASERAPMSRKMSSGSSPERRVRTRSNSFIVMEGGQATLRGSFSREYVGDGIDLHLLKLELVKKSIAKDTTSIFRAVCEQLSSVQTDHESLRVLVENILKPITQRHYINYKDHLESRFDRDREILTILSDVTSSRIKVYRVSADEPIVYEGTVVEEGREVMVCESPHRSVFEPVYTKEMHEALAISQSIVYRTLYEGVFKFTKKAVDDVIDYIEHDIYSHSHQQLNEEFVMTPQDRHMHSTNAPCKHNRPQFPFCVCKALDPSIYRNVDYDLHKRKRENSKQAELNSQAVKFGEGARCLIADRGFTKGARVVGVVSATVRRISFDGAPHIQRDYHVNDLRAPPAAPIAHQSMHTLMPILNGGGGGSMKYLPGCYPPIPPTSMYGQQAPPFPPPQHFPPGGPFHQYPPPPHFGVPPPNFFYGADPLPPMTSSPGMGLPPAPLDSTLDSSMFSAATPLSSRKKGDDGRRGRDGNKKPRALSIELADSPATGKWTKGEAGGGGEKRYGVSRRATEGDTAGEMPRQLQPKQQQQLQKQHRLSTCSSVPENDSSPALPSVGGTPVQQLQQQSGAAAAAAVRKQLPSLLPMPKQQTGYSTSSDWTGDDAVFEEALTNSQQSLANELVGAEAAVADGFSISVPHITLEEFNKEVNQEAAYSKCSDGSDLPDKMSTRFFYNLGLKYFRDKMLGFDAPCPPSPGALPMPPQFVPPSPMVQSGSSAFGFNFDMHQMSMHPASTPIHPSAPPSTPAFTYPHPNMPSHLVQYCYPRVDGMPSYGYGVNDVNGLQMDEQQQQRMLQQLQQQELQQQMQQPIPSPTHAPVNVGGTIFFPQ
ncbi:hypothetical protein PFISCL1PPCAC_11144, partial [Pristionchus fissidentatus]